MAPSQMGVSSFVQGRFTELALHAEKLGDTNEDDDPSAACSCCGVAPRGRHRAHLLGYGSHVETLPGSVWSATCSAGNPFALGAAKESETVVDLGCGSGVDLCIAANMVGPTGHVIGVDANEAMLAAAHRNVEAAGLSERVQLIHAPFDSDCPDIPAAVADLVISNGALNLAERKM